MKTVILEDESLRDGLQFEKQVVSTQKKLELFNHLVRAGVSRIQVGSFVNPKVVPQMGDTDEFVALVKQTPGVLVTGLVLNGRGLERAMACGLEHISLSVSVSDAHSLKNVRKSYGDALDSVTELIRQAVQAGIKVRAGAQCAFGCIYEGVIPEQRVLEALESMAGAGAAEFNLADTTGMANPFQVKELTTKVGQAFPEVGISLHLHDTRGLAVANMVAGYEAGVRIFDTSAGGLGGCPFVKGAAGNIATEDAVNLFESMAVDTGIDLEKICQVAETYEQLLGRNLPGRMGRVLQVQKTCEG
ncbi:hydroxymethylglutaryl-CoA lyase [Desulfopila sp. IMCC35008]|uniref:hydroxymethylglutaryl-CoA lyase n=1 Tax=Desulfopila sp. IMCC35008 TaxID=2653858 RepID=UPI0013D36D52|nr:hydroxymethylglutaryl-CoA lyase [Desulfopila sp. IMCC35008]